MGALGFEPRLAGFFCSLVRREAGQRSGITGRRSSRSSTVSKPTCRHSCATGARSTTRLYYTPVGELHAFALRRARLRRRSFFFLHFQRCWPCFFHAREPRFMGNVLATCLQYISASDSTNDPARHQVRSPERIPMLIDVGCSRGSAYRMVTSVMTARSVCNSRPWSPSFAEKMTPPESPNIPMGWLQLLPLLMSFTM